MLFYKKREDLNYLSDDKLKYLFAENMIQEFCKDKYDIKELRINLPVMTFLLRENFMQDMIYLPDATKEIYPNVIIYKKTYYEPTKNGFKKDHKIRETVKIMTSIGSDTWSRLHSPRICNSIVGLDNVFNYIAENIYYDLLRGDLRYVTSLNVYSIRVPDIDLVTTDLIPKLIENKIEII